MDLDLLEGVDRDASDTILWMESEDCAEFPSIWITEPYSEAPKSEKKYYAEIGGSPERDLKGILEYIHEHIEDEIVEKTYSLRDLTEECLKEAFLDDDTDYKLIITR